MSDAELVRQIQLSDSATDFLNSQLGQTIQRKANDQMEAALEKLRTVNPNKPEKVRKYQNDIKVAQMALSWLLEIIVEGGEAESILDEMEE